MKKQRHLKHIYVHPSGGFQVRITRNATMKRTKKKLHLDVSVYCSAREYGDRIKARKASIVWRDIILADMQRKGW